MKTKLLGDPHLGRAFIHGVPLNRRGDRERMVWQQFQSELSDTGLDFHICLGDLFDKAVVPYDVIAEAARIYMESADQNPGTKYIILRGNHDISRDLERLSAFDMFVSLVNHHRNVIPVRSPMQIGPYQFYPWDFEQSIINTDCEAAFGHWDVEISGFLVPWEKLRTQTIYTGHDHKARVIKKGDKTLTVFGSMQPYAHGEQSDDKLYVTVGLDEVIKNPLSFKNKVVRIDLKAGEVLNTELDCLQLSVRRPEDVTAEETVQIGDFDLNALTKEAFLTEGVPDDIRDKVLEKFAEWRG